MTLDQKKCIPCRGDMAPLTFDEAKLLLKQLNGWQINELPQLHLRKEFSYSDFKGAFVKASCVAELAEQEGHHPDLFISWGKLGISIWTHKINGLTESDFVLAAKIDKTLG